MGKDALQKINDLASVLPFEVLQDIEKRVGDWLAFGGGPDDPYIHQQLRFAKKFVPKVGDQS